MGTQRSSLIDVGKTQTFEMTGKLTHWLLVAACCAWAGTADPSCPATRGPFMLQSNTKTHLKVAASQNADALKSLYENALDHDEGGSEWFSRFIGSHATEALL